MSARLDEQHHVRRILTLLGVGALLTALGNVLRAVDDNLAELPD